MAADADADEVEKSEHGTIPDPIPEADDPEVAREWEESDPMGGPSPTG